MKIKIFYHVCAVNNYKSIVRDQLSKIIFSGLFDVVSDVFVTIVGEFADDCEQFLSQFGPKVKVIKKDKFDTSFERLTLLNIPNYIDKTDLFLYIHSKGVTKPENEAVQDWRWMMEYFLIKRWRECLKALESHHVVGCKFQGWPKPHFSGNFWWARADYYLGLPREIDGDYFSPEAYVCQNGAKTYSHFDTFVQLYTERFPPSNFIY